MRGKGGWLFLANDSNDFVQQQLGELLFTDEQLADWTSLLETRIERLRARGAHYRFLVAPNAHSVYPHNLPFEVPEKVVQPVPQLIEHLERVGSPARLTYPLAQLIARRDEPVFTRTNSHWTDLGAFVAYEALMDDIAGDVPVRRLAESDLVFHEVVRPGDLGHKVDPPEASPHPIGMPARPIARLTNDNRVYLNGHRIDYECPEAGESVCLILGDSFAHMLLPFMAETFGRLTFAHIATLDLELVDELDADLVVSVMNERFMIRVPEDEDARTLRSSRMTSARGGSYIHPA